MEGGRVNTADLREATRAELEALARLASLRPDLRVIEGAEGTGWRINVESGRMIVDGSDLAGREPEFLAAITLHECAHATLTRTRCIVPKEILRNPVEFHLLNVMEDGRIETWLEEWLPGCGPWLAAAQATVAAEHLRSHAAKVGRIPAEDFCAAILLGRHRIALPALIHPEAAAAVAETADAVARYFDCWPRFDVVERLGGQYAERYVSGHLAAAFALEDAGIAPSSREMAVRIHQHRAWVILQREIRPVYLRLVEMTPSLQGELDLNALMAGLPSLARGKGRAMARTAAGLKRLDTIRGRPAAGIAGGEAPTTSHTYGKECLQFACEIANLSDHLLRLRRDRGTMKWQRGQSEGQKPDLVAVMAFAASGRNPDRLWSKRHLPHRIAPAVLLLVDCSVSMEGEKSEAAFASAVIIREACRRAGVPLAVLGYNDGPFRLVAFHEGREADERLVAVRHPAGGTRLIPALHGAERVLKASPYREHLVLVMADGDFDEHEKPCFEAILARWKIRAVQARGLGIGPETTAMGEWFPGDPTEIGPGDLPAEIAGMLEHFIGELYGGRHAA